MNNIDKSENLNVPELHIDLNVSINKILKLYYYIVFYYRRNKKLID